MDLIWNIGMNTNIILEKLLKKVEKPGRYIGMEVNAVNKDPEKMDVNFCFAFPDIYEIGMSYLGMQILYSALNKEKNIYCQRTFQPQNDMEELMRKECLPLFALEKKTLVKDMDFLGFTLQYEMCYTTVLNMIDLAGLNVYAKDRTDKDPIIVCGGPCAYNPEPLADFVDMFLIGDGEKLLPEMVNKYIECKNNGMSKDDFLKEAVKISGVYVPKFYEVEYNEDGTIRPIETTLNYDKLKLNDIPDDRKLSLIAASIRQPEFSKEAKKITVSQGATRSDIQKYIDECSDDVGGTIIIPAGRFEMDGPLELKNNVRLHLNDGATLAFTSNPDAYLPVVVTRYEGIEVNARCPMIHAHWQENIAITGEGNATIDAGGNEMAEWGKTIGVESWDESILGLGTHGSTPETADINRLREMGDKLVPLSDRIFGEGTKLRPCAIEFNQCSRAMISGVTIKNCPFWCVHPLYCEDFTIKHVTIESNYPNNDGVTPESSRRVLIEDCEFRTGDDAVAVKSGRDADGRRIGRPSEDIVIRNCKMMSKCNGISIGSEISGGVKNIYISNLDIGNVKNGIIFKSNLDRGGYIENVYVDRVTIASVAGAALRFETNYLHYRGGNFPTRYNNFRINNTTVGKSAEWAIFYEGNETEKITDISVKNFYVGAAKYPYYLRNTQNCTFTNCTVNNKPIPETPEESPVKRTCDVW